jgi:hypothetical protein
VISICARALGDWLGWAARPFIHYFHSLALCGIFPAANRARSLVIELQTLQHVNVDDLNRLAAGYTSPGKDTVTETETRERTALPHLQVALRQPYVKQAPPCDAETWARYQPVLSQGLSQGTSDGDALVGLALVEAPSSRPDVVASTFSAFSHPTQFPHSYPRSPHRTPLPPLLRHPRHGIQPAARKRHVTARPWLPRAARTGTAPPGPAKCRHRATQPLARAAPVGGGKAPEGESPQSGFTMIGI